MYLYVSRSVVFLDACFPERMMYRELTEYFNRISSYGWSVVITELVIIGIVVYIVLKFLEGTRGLRLFRGLILILASILLIIGVLAENFHLTRIKVLSRPVLYIIFFGSLVVFQPELRRGLMRLGEARWFRRLMSASESTIQSVTSAAKYLSAHKIGALIAIERQVGLASIIESGVLLDAHVSAELLKTIFWPGSALHDLGVIIQEDRIVAASCQFPLTESENVDPSLGSRHRAAVGLTEDSDAVVVVVSEETGRISLAVDGKLYLGLAHSELEEKLKQLLLSGDNDIGLESA